jgi:hypothetical protein
MAHYQDHTQFFHYVPAQEWSRATRDYKKSMHKKLSFSTAREGRSEVFNLIFFIGSHYIHCLQKQGEQSNALPCQKGIEFPYPRLPRPPEVPSK